jgi:tetraacyldisaccharide-1-P 4'-kinase
MADDKGKTFFMRAVGDEASEGIYPAARGGLFLASALYDGVIRARSFLYSEGLMPRHRLPGRVVCVGNITLGGTGKTPMVAWISNWLSARGKRVAILTRGYGRTPDGASGDKTSNGSSEPTASGPAPRHSGISMPTSPCSTTASSICASGATSTS